MSFGTFTYIQILHTLFTNWYVLFIVHQMYGVPKIQYRLVFLWTMILQNYRFRALYLQFHTYLFKLIK